MTIGTFFYHVVLPVEKTNLVTNPSFEINEAGWTATAIGTAVPVTDTQYVGAASYRLTRGGIDVFSASIPVSLQASTAYTASVYVRQVGATSGSMRLQIGGTTSAYAVGSLWQRISLGTTTSTSGVGSLIVSGSSTAAATIWIDGAQVEAGSLTTFIDGDQPGCAWIGDPHLSQSFRSNQTRAGGTVVPLASLGLRVETHSGVGAAPVVNLNQSRAVLDGAEFQRQRYDSREFILTSTLTGTTVPDLHRVRRQILDAFNIDQTIRQSPVRFLYTGAGGTTTIDAIYSGGLDITDMLVVNDNVAARFTAFDPAWYSEQSSGTKLTSMTTIGSTNSVAWRDPRGVWGTFGIAGTTVGLASGTTAYAVGGTVLKLLETNGTLFVAGSFSRPGGTWGHAVARYSRGSWGTLDEGSVTHSASLQARELQYRAGTLFMAFSGTNSVNGTVTNGLAIWLEGISPKWGTFPFAAGGSDVGFQAIGFDNEGLLLASRTGTDFGGTSIYRWNGVSAVAVVPSFPGGAGTIAGPGRISDLQNWGGTIIAVGNFLVAGSFSAGFRNLFYVDTNGSVGTFAGPDLVSTDRTNVVYITDSQRIYIGGQYGTIGVRQYNPTSGVIPVSGITLQNVGTIYPQWYGIRDVLQMPDGVYACGDITRVGNIPSPFGVARWNGASWSPIDIRIDGGTNGVRALARSADGTFYAGGEFRGVGTVAGVTTVVNTGMSNAYPLLIISNRSGVPQRFYQIINTTTGDALYFDLVIASQEVIEINLSPGQRSVWSSYRGNLISSVLGGSNLATWRLKPGTNTVSVFADVPEVFVSIAWRNRNWSIDGGTAV